MPLNKDDFRIKSSRYSCIQSYLNSEKFSDVDMPYDKV